MNVGLILKGGREGVGARINHSMKVEIISEYALA
jgi:hypothetical protein